jgi:hypothetical protein
MLCCISNAQVLFQPMAVPHRKHKGRCQLLPWKPGCDSLIRSHKM